ncbi:MAG: PAP/fibrillin family protein [Pseudomonadota bacterium]
MGAKESLLATIEAHYVPGTAVTVDVDNAVKAAAKTLEEGASEPDLIAHPTAVNGVWQLRFDSRNLLHESANMARMSGGMLPEQTITIANTFQELYGPEEGKPGFYRNTMVMEQKSVGFFYQSTASFTVDPEAPNVFQVSFSTTSFVPLNASDGPGAVRAALNMPAQMPMHHVQSPPIGPFPSLVTYLDDTLRINRGADYIAVLERMA